ncbi:MAG: ACT domain-containing protein [Planctomycetota bacterium]
MSALQPRRREGVFAVVSVQGGPLALDCEALAVEAMVREAEGWTLVMPLERAQAAGLSVLLECAWLTLGLETSLEAIGITARVAGKLAAHGIACNVLAGACHDHILVPVARAAEAQEAIATIVLFDA